MSNTKKRKKQKQTLMNSEGKYTQEQIEAFARILQAGEWTHEEKRMIQWHRFFSKGKARELADTSYGVNLSGLNKKFRDKCYDEYAFGKVFKDFSGFHMLMITKCAVFELDWTKHITENGDCAL